MRLLVLLSALAAMGVILFFGMDSSAQILPSVLDQFTAGDVPARGPAESTMPSTRAWRAPAHIPTTWPGRQLAQHPFIYAGEGYNMLFVVRDGKVVWTYWCGKG